MKRIIPALFIGLLANLSAQAGMEMGHAGTAVVGHATVFSTGLIKKVDKAQGKLTIRHGPLENLDMPAMTMAFRVVDPGVLDRVRPGETIRFHAEMKNGQMVASQIKPVH